MTISNGQGFTFLMYSWVTLEDLGFYIILSHTHKVILSLDSTHTQRARKYIKGWRLENFMGRESSLRIILSGSEPRFLFSTWTSSFLFGGRRGILVLFTFYVESI